MIRNNSALHLAHSIAEKVEIDDDLQSAFASIDRKVFIPQGFSFHAYKLDALPLNAGQWISSPLTVAKMTVALEYQGADSILEIGCGSGYQAAILSRLVRRIFTIERVETLLEEAIGRFDLLGLNNINTKFDDGIKGWKSYAPYDRILFSASTKEIPKHLFEQLNENGILVAPIEKNGKQVITKFVKRRGRVETHEIEECLFVPVVEGVKKSI